MPGRISVVVPVYNVEAYLDECLDSIAAQTFTDLEVVLVDDGSTDGSSDIAAARAEQDRRFRVVRQENGGLGSARNTGARESSGELMMFVDSDDVLFDDAIEQLCRALDETGSDFASGYVWRIRPSGLEPSKWLAPVFAETRLATHVTRFRPLIADRIAWNKLWRRTFWDEHAFVFPKGLYEDTPVTIPAHFLARSVDVVSAPVYQWRARAGGKDRSITQRRLEVRTLVDRLTSIQSARMFLKAYPDAHAIDWYDASVLADDLGPYPDLLRKAGDDFRREFLERVNIVLDDMNPVVFDELPPDVRLKWQLVRDRRLDALVAPPAEAGLARRIGRFAPTPVRRFVGRQLRRRVGPD